MEARVKVAGFTIGVPRMRKMIHSVLRSDKNPSFRIYNTINAEEILDRGRDCVVREWKYLVILRYRRRGLIMPVSVGIARIRDAFDHFRHILLTTVTFLFFFFSFFSLP